MGSLAESRRDVTGCECAVREVVLLEVGVTLRRGDGEYSHGWDTEKESAFEYQSNLYLDALG